MSSKSFGHDTRLEPFSALDRSFKNSTTVEDKTTNLGHEGLRTALIAHVVLQETYRQQISNCLSLMPATLHP